MSRKQSHLAGDLWSQRPRGPKFVPQKYREQTGRPLGPCGPFLRPGFRVRGTRDLISGNFLAATARIAFEAWVGERCFAVDIIVLASFLNLR